MFLEVAQILPDSGCNMLQNMAVCLLVLITLSMGHGLNEEDFQNLLTEVQSLRSSHEDLKAKQDVLEDRVEKLEELAKIGTRRTCAEYAQYGLKTSGLYMVDPDGPLLGHPPFQVFCNFDAGTTRIKYYLWMMSLERVILRQHRNSP